MTIDPADDVGELSSRDDCSDQTLRSIPLPLPAKGIDEQHRDHMTMTEQQWDLLHRLLGTEGILIVKHGTEVIHGNSTDDAEVHCAVSVSC